MHILTWNVNGIRAALGKGALNWAFSEKPDLLCLQEVKARPEQLNSDQSRILTHPHVWNPAERAGYSGVATFFENQPEDVVVGMGDRKFDIEGRVVQTVQAGFRLFNLYIPSGTRGHERVKYKLEFYAHLLELCDSLHKKGECLVLTGDFNTAHQPIDLKYPKANKNTSGYLPEEREWVQKFLDHGFVDVFRHLYPDRIQYTWWTSRLRARERGIGWRLDYYLVSEKMVSRVRDVIVHEEVMGSDHCPVALILN